MTLLIFVTGMVVAIVSNRQADRHVHMLKVAYERLGVPMPPAKQRLPILEALLNVVLGVILLGWSAMSLVGMFADWKRVTSVDSAQFAAALLGTGTAMIVLGLKALRQNHERGKLLRG